MDAPYSSTRPRRRMWIIVTAGVILASLMLGGYLYLGLQGEQELLAAVAELDRDDPGWRLEEIEAKRAVVPDEENSALRVMAAKNALPNSWPPLPKLSAPSPQGSPAEERSLEERIDELDANVQLGELLTLELRKELEKVTPALVEARKLANLANGRYPVVWGRNPFDLNFQCVHARPVVQLLRFAATLDAHERQADQALDMSRAMLNTGRSIGDEPILISQLVRIACEMLAVQTVERMLAQGQPSAATLKAAQQLVEAEIRQPILWIAVRGERAYQYEMLKALASGQLPASGTTAGASSEPGEKFAEFLQPGQRKRDMATHLRLMNELVEIAKLPVEQQGAQLAQLDSKSRQMAGKRVGGLSALALIPACVRVGESFRRFQADLHCTAVALSVERYRGAHNGQWPASLHELVRAGLIQSVPLDPFDGKPLRFRLTDYGVVIYSVGPDGTDNGGKINRRNPAAPGSDIGFRLWDVDKRRQPAPELLPPPTPEDS